MAKMPEKKQVDDACEALDSVEREWLRRPGVTAVDVGFKIKGDKMTDQVAIRAHVERKRDPVDLASSEAFNETGKRTKTVGGFPVDVIEATYAVDDSVTVSSVDQQAGAPIAIEDATAIESLARQQRVRPLMGGFSCGNPRITSGTIGAIVFNKTTCKPMILSNWHVLAGSPSAAVGEPITQPGRSDSGTVPADRVARLSQMVLDQRMDAAVAQIDAGVTHDREVIGLGVIRGHEDPRLGMLVSKSGRTTDVTRGVIDGVSMRLSINYRSAGVRQAFRNQVRIVPRPPWPAVASEISSGGDSGSVWVNDRTDRAIGLHFAGESTSPIADENALANPIGPIMDQFNISFAPVICFQSPPVFDLCRRFPALCRLRVDDLFIDPIGPVVGPINPVNPVGPIGPLLGGSGGPVLAGLAQSGEHAGGCNCTGERTATGSGLTLGDLLQALAEF